MTARLARPLAALAALAALARAQEAPPAEPAEEPTWELSGSVFWSDPPGSDDRVTSIVYADRGPLHLELRYGYEDAETASLFAGWNLAWSGESEVELAVTPMLGVVAGDTDGLAPGAEAALDWRRISWYAEAEYLLDRHDRDDDFFYSWSTLTYGFTDWLSAGLVVERTKLVDTGLSVQRGLALELSGAHVGLSLYAYNLGDEDDSYAVVALELAP